MRGAGVHDGDIVIIDRSLTPHNNNVILAVLNGEFTLKHFVRRDSGTFLYPNHPDFKPVKIEAEMNFEIWGVATYAIHRLR